MAEQNQNSGNITIMPQPGLANLLGTTNVYSNFGNTEDWEYNIQIQRSTQMSKNISIGLKTPLGGSSIGWTRNTSNDLIVNFQYYSFGSGLDLSVNWTKKNIETLQPALMSGFGLEGGPFALGVSGKIGIGRDTVIDSTRNSAITVQITATAAALIELNGTAKASFAFVPGIGRESKARRNFNTDSEFRSDPNGGHYASFPQPPSYDFTSYSFQKYTDSGYASDYRPNADQFYQNDILGLYNYARSTDDLSIDIIWIENQIYLPSLSSSINGLNIFPIQAAPNSNTLNYVDDNLHKNNDNIFIYHSVDDIYHTMIMGIILRVMATCRATVMPITRHTTISTQVTNPAPTTAESASTSTAMARASAFPSRSPSSWI